jgi:hypothetical protein
VFTDAHAVINGRHGGNELMPKGLESARQMTGVFVCITMPEGPTPIGSDVTPVMLPGTLIYVLPDTEDC